MADAISEVLQRSTGEEDGRNGPWTAPTFWQTNAHEAHRVHGDLHPVLRGDPVMRSRTDLDGKTLIDARPLYLLVGPALETDAEKLLTSINATTAEDVNPFGGKLRLLVEPRLGDSVDWYLFADPARLPCIAHAYLAGAQGVQIQRQEAWNTLGLSFRAFLDFGAAWTDWRGAQKMLGA
ncbi:hypothetical protein [Gemmobacter aquatilis]|nr:hypothetical protein [Gemmobacter aquatilis]